MSQMKDHMFPFIKRDAIEEMVNRIAHQINQDYEDKQIVFVCPLKGSILFFSDLVRKIKVSIMIDFVQLQSHSHHISMSKDVTVDITDRHVLIIEEIIDSGRALSFLKSRLLASHPLSVKIVTLLDKPARRELSIKADYTGRTIEDRFVIGYGLDLEGIGRNYPDIYILNN